MAAWSTGHLLVSAELTHHGHYYLEQNPRLRNPINWPLVLVILWTIILALALANLIIRALTPS